MPYHGPTIDIFAIAIVLFNMVTGRDLFYRARERDLCPYDYLVNQSELFWSRIQNSALNLSLEFQSLMNSMLAMDPAQRLSIEQVLSHAWFSNGDEASTEQIAEEMEARREQADIAVAQRD